MPNAYWRSLKEREAEELQPPKSETVPTQGEIPSGPGRRGFLKAAGFSFASAWLAACSRAPEQKALPFLEEPEGIIPGKSYWYASTCAACPAACGLLVKTRDGRPIKLEGNPGHPLSQGGLCAVGQASILGLYDSRRLKGPVAAGKSATWEEVDRELGRKLEAVRGQGGAVRLLTGTVHSPTELAVIRRFLAQFKDGRHVQYDALSCSAILDAHERTFGVRVLPRYRFDQADVVVGFDADFLGTWISPVEFTAGYSSGRKPEFLRFCYHIQAESRMSLTGTKADRRIPVSPAGMASLMAEVAAAVEGGAAAGEAGEIAGRLLQAKGRSLVVCGSQDTALQMIANTINHALGNYGQTLDIVHPSRQRLGNDRELELLLRELEAGKVRVLLVAGANPVFELPGGEAVKRAEVVVSFSERPDETAEASHYVCPAPHALESWGDAEPAAGLVTIRQPAVRPLGGARPFVETLAAWTGRPQAAYELVRTTWREEIHPRQRGQADFETFWEQALQRGYAETGSSSPAARAFARPDLKRPAGAPDLELVLYPTPAMLDGRHAYNPWLHELPDPVTKVTWDNYVSLAPGAAARLGIADGDMVRVESGGRAMELPALLQPGQNERTIAVALGYGSLLSRRFADLGPNWIDRAPTVGETGLVGVNAAPWLRFTEGTLRFESAGVTVTKTGKRRPLACTQQHHTLSVPAHLAPSPREPRPIVQETTVARWNGERLRQQPLEPDRPELWPPDHTYGPHRWAMVVDLNACTGCSACVVACQVENNIPVVGRDEVVRKREMHWIRVDRYYSGPVENPQVAHQPMFCQQCEHAPCETVCPVLATVHSAEGLNQQVYNRCVGTRYCANNCPYKTRRFNWFAYARKDALANLVLNPDVTVRSRGVMEKCTFCVQRIQEAKIEAKRRGEPVQDGEILTACQQSCPAQAIYFGNLNQKGAKAAQMMTSARRYRVLEEINVRPSVGYLKIVRHESAAGGEKQHG
ncbi:MAG: 4Fe-4S dicluster domain-containing protein [Bryobacterales bacterium]|nr:4Fe-4S dicluster domain-containing protein [Bryobacterales bacterium]